MFQRENAHAKNLYAGRNTVNVSMQGWSAPRIVNAATVIMESLRWESDLIREWKSKLELDLNFERLRKI